MTAPRSTRTPFPVPVLARIGAVAFWLLIWQAASMAVGSGLILAGPLDTGAALVRLLPSPAFWGQVGFSALRIVGGALAGYACAFIFAATAWHSRIVRALLQPVLSAIKGTPVACVVVLLLIWIGSRNVSTVAVFLMVLPGVYFPVLTGLDELDVGQRELFKVFGAGRLTRLLALVWPGVLPYVAATSQTVLGMSWKAGVAAELIGVPMGSIGERIYQSKLLLETADLFAWTIVVVLLSWVFEQAVLALLKASWPAMGRAAVRLRHASTPRMQAKCGAIVEAKHLSVGYAEQAVCAPISFRLSSGDALCLSAPSGAGKTTLLRTIAGLQAPINGELTSTSERIATVFQDARLIEDLTAVENVKLFAAADCDDTTVRAMLAELLPMDALDAPVRELSGGQRRRVELIRAFAAPANLILLDEPFTGLDTEMHQQALTFIDRHRSDYPIILASHDAQDAAALKASLLALRKIEQ